MAKHSGEVPRTGDGRNSGRKPQNSEMSVVTKGGTILWKATAAIFGIGRGKRRQP